MATKTYKVREGFSFRITDEKGNVKVFTEGDTINLDVEVGDNAHQLELATPEKGGSSKNSAPESGQGQG